MTRPAISHNIVMHSKTYCGNFRIKPINKINHSDGLIALLSRLSLRSNARHSNFVALLDKLEALQVVADGQP